MYSSTSSFQQYGSYYHLRWKNSISIVLLLVATGIATETKALRIVTSVSTFESGGASRWKSQRILWRQGIDVGRKSSFYDDFEQFNKEEEDDDDDDDDSDNYMTQDDKARIEMFRSQIMMSESADTRNNLSQPDINELDNKEDDDDEEEDEDDEDEQNDIFNDSKQESTASFNTVEELISFASGGPQQQNKQSDWAIPLLDYDGSSTYENTSLQMANAIVKALKSGVILIANPEKFCAPSTNKENISKKKSQPSPSLLSKFGLTLPPPSDLGPDRRADLLPVLILLERHPLRGSKAVLLNRRTGYLLGDLEQPSSNLSSSPPKLGAFMIQPLWFGGTSASAGSTVGGGGLDMLHLCPTVEGCQRLTEDGLFWGGDILQAQEAMNCKSLERPMTGFDFKFFVQSTRWLPTQLEREVRDGTWFIASVSKEVLFKPRDRLGTMRAKPLWTEIMELMGGQFLSVRNSLYNEE